MITRLFFTIIIVLVLFEGCIQKTSDDNSIDIVTVNPNNAKEYVNLSEIADSVKCIKLQTDSGSIMGRIKEIIIKKKYIYALDISQQIVFVFDKEGKFVSKLDKNGQGPGEYVWMGPIFIDDNEEYIELINYMGGNKLKYSNISFELVDVLPFPNVSCNTCRKKNTDIYYFSTQQSTNTINGKKTNAGLVIVDSLGNIKTLFDKNIETNNFSFSPNIESFTKNDKNELFLSLMYDNTFYQLKSGVPFPILTIDFGKFGIENSIGLESTEKQMKYIKESNGLASFPILNINNSDIMSFSYFFKQDYTERFYQGQEDIRHYIKMKKTNKIYHVKNIKNDITSFPRYVYLTSDVYGCAHEAWYGDYLVDIVVPNYYFSSEKNSEIFIDGIGKITSEDNPVIVMIKLKK